MIMIYWCSQPIILLVFYHLLSARSRIFLHPLKLHSYALSPSLIPIFKVVDGITSSEMCQVEICICALTHMRMSEPQLVCLLPGIITIWSTKGVFWPDSCAGRAGCRYNIRLSIFISFRLPGRLKALTGIYCHLIGLHLLCFTAQHAGMRNTIWNGQNVAVNWCNKMVFLQQEAIIN